MTLKLTGPARRDINAIVGYIAKDSPKASEQFANNLARKFTALADAPLIGREQDDYGVGIRTFPFGNYMIFYRPAKDGVVIVRVLHGARNLPETFKAES
jgi:toxin ParE1/3/4